MKWICKIMKKHMWGEEMYIPPHNPRYMLRICKLCDCMEYSYDLGKTWTTEYRLEI